MGWFLGRQYRVLLVTLILLFLAHPIATLPAVRVVYDLVVTLVFLAAFAVIFTNRFTRVFAVVLGLPPLVANWTGYALPSVPPGPLAMVFHVSATLFLGLTIVTVLRSINREPTVTADGVCGALCGYLVIGLLFGHLYCVVEIVHPGSFHAAEELVPHLADGAARHSLLTYFSFITLATVGYGDIVPGSPVTRWLATVEVILGQFYLAVLIAELVGKRGAQAVAPPPSFPPGS